MHSSPSVANARRAGWCGAGLIVAVLVAACVGGYPNDFERGDPVTVIKPTDESHPGWGFAECDTCHDLPSVHFGSFPVSECRVCHGPNGTDASGIASTHSAPQLSPLHPGWQTASCSNCHAPHSGQYAFTVCGACHGQNGGPVRPENHWMTNCNDCHSEGPAPWNTTTHAGFEPSAPTGCINCHR